VRCSEKSFFDTIIYLPFFSQSHPFCSISAFCRKINLSGLVVILTFKEYISKYKISLGIRFKEEEEKKEN
jgi:hypothetical protein